MGVIVSLLVFSILLGGAFGRSLSQQPILTIKANNGQVYDCVDFYKQPAFKHPLLKDQIPKVRPSIVENDGKIAKNIGLKNGGCPPGTVPILRHSYNLTGRGEISQPPPTPPQQHCSAVIATTLDDMNRKFYGSSVDLSLHKPAVQSSQWSSARVKLSNGLESIEAGWMVNPSFFHDNEAHLYGKFTTKQGGCINHACLGFVQVSKTVALGVIPDRYSSIRGTQYSWNITIQKHQDDGHWWLTISLNDDYPVGYWPNSLFTSLKDVANQVSWGGEVDNPQSITPRPEMGNSRKASYDTGNSAFCKHVTVDTDTAKAVEPQGTEKVYHCPGSYTVLDEGYQGEFWGRIMYYGGYFSAIN
ncbi:unnamed protein product [Amaranthus hypochondriacus]